MALPATQIAIVGAGPAGVAAAVQCKRLGIMPLLLDGAGEAGGLVANGFLVENYPGLPPMPGTALANLLRTHLERFELAVTKGLVRHIERNRDGFVVHGDFATIGARAVIVAVGTRPRELPVPGAAEATGTRLFYDVRQLLDSEHTRRAERVLVIGGGEAALDYALSLAERGIAATLLIRGERLRARGRLVQLVEKSPLIAVKYRAAPTAVRQTARGIELELHTPDGAHTDMGDGAIVAIGRRPKGRDLVSGLDAEAALAVTTQVPGLFIAGDARWGALGQVGMAVGDGLRAAIAAVERLDAR